MKIAIDGPAGAGKSTVAKKLSQELGFIYIDTGAMYRSLTWKALKRGLDLNDSQALTELAGKIEIHFEHDAQGQKIICDSVDVSEEIRSPQVSAAVSKVASYPEIRAIMVNQQQELGRCVSVVMDGRDIGECVLPDADYKFFLTAGIEERARRRVDELKAQGYPGDHDAIREDMIKRDREDTEREVGALKILNDSIVINTSSLTAEQVMHKILSIVRGE